MRSTLRHQVEPALDKCALVRFSHGRRVDDSRPRPIRNWLVLSQSKSVLERRALRNNTATRIRYCPPGGDVILIDRSRRPEGGHVQSARRLLSPSGGSFGHEAPAQELELIRPSGLQLAQRQHTDHLLIRAEFEGRFEKTETWEDSPVNI